VFLAGVHTIPFMYSLCMNRQRRNQEVGQKHYYNNDNAFLSLFHSSLNVVVRILCFLNLLICFFEDKVKGWAGNECLRYTRDSTGYCDASGVCISSCDQVPGQSSIALVSCGSSVCRRLANCVPGELIQNADQVTEICFTSRDVPSCPAVNCTGLISFFLFCFAAL